MSFSDYKKDQYITELTRISNVFNAVYSEIKSSPLSTTYKAKILGYSYHTFAKKIKAQNFTIGQLQIILKGL